MLHIFSQLIIIKIMRYFTLAHCVQKMVTLHSQSDYSLDGNSSSSQWPNVACSYCIRWCNSNLKRVALRRVWPCWQEASAPFRPLVWGCRTWGRESESGNSFAMGLSSVVSLGRYGLGLKKEDARGSHSTDVDPWLLHTWRCGQDYLQAILMSKVGWETQGKEGWLCWGHSKGHSLLGLQQPWRVQHRLQIIYLRNRACEAIRAELALATEENNGVWEPQGRWFLRRSQQNPMTARTSMWHLLPGAEFWYLWKTLPVFPSLFLLSMYDLGGDSKWLFMWG